MARTHGRIANLDLEQPFGRIEPLELPDPIACVLAAFRQVPYPVPEGIHVLGDQRAEGFFDDQADQIVRRVIAA